MSCRCNWMSACACCVHWLRQLLLAGKLIENEDCRRDDFVDDTHFVWRVDPVAFMRATGLRSIHELGNRASLTATQAATSPPPSAAQVAIPFRR